MHHSFLCINGKDAPLSDEYNSISHHFSPVAIINTSDATYNFGLSKPKFMTIKVHMTKIQQLKHKTFYLHEWNIYIDEFRNSACTMY